MTYLAEPRIGKLGSVNVAAVIADLLLDVGAQPLSDPQVGAFTRADPRKDRNRLSLTLIMAWLLRDDALRESLGGASPADREALAGALGAMCRRWLGPASRRQ